MLTSVRAGVEPAARAESVSRTAAVPAEVVVVVALTAVGAAWRFATITDQSYWFDEATTAHAMQLSFGAMLHAVASNESTPPLYYVLAWVWAKVFGSGEAGLRSLSALAGAALIPIAYLCGRELVSRATGFVAAALVALSPFMIWYSQEARAYMLFAALCGLSLFLFARARRSPSTRNLIWWAVFSSLAVLTHFFAGFVIAPEALWLLMTVRSRAIVIAAAAVAAAQLAVVPLLVNDLSHPLLGWIKQFPLHVRIEQVPIAFGLSTLYQSSIVTHGLLWGALLAAIVAGLVLFGGEHKYRVGVGLVVGIAAAGLVTPLVVAALGRDYYIARNLIAAWVPLAIAVAAACTVPRTLPVGLPLAVGVLGGFIYAGIYINQHPQYQRSDWRGVATALGNPTVQRAVVVYDGEFGSKPLSLYLHGVPWNSGSSQPVLVREVDVVGNTSQTRPRSLPAGTKLIASKAVTNYQVERFALDPAWYGSPSEIGARARTLLTPAPVGPAVLVQPGR